MPFTDEKLLRQIPLFTLLDDDELHALALQLDERDYLKGQMIFQAGERGGAMYIVQSGKVEVFLNDANGDRINLGYVSPGDLFGEFSLLDNEPRSAGAQAVENTRLVIVDQNDLSMLVKAHPAAALDMMAMLTRRIRESNTRVQERSIRNVNEEIKEMPMKFGDRLADLLTQGASNIRFTYFSFIWFAVWIVLNLNFLPGIQPFDPYPFGFLTMVVSLEAIFLSLFVLISQDRQAKRDKIRNDIEYEVNMRAEVEIRELGNRMDNLEQVLLEHLSDIKSLQIARRAKRLPKKFD